MWHILDTEMRNNRTSVKYDSNCTIPSYHVDAFCNTLSKIGYTDANSFSPRDLTDWTYVSRATLHKQENLGKSCTLWSKMAKVLTSHVFFGKTVIQAKTLTKRNICECLELSHCQTLHFYVAKPESLSCKTKKVCKFDTTTSCTMKVWYTKALYLNKVSLSFSDSCSSSHWL